MQLTSRTADLRCRLINTAGRPSQPGQADWGFRLQGARNKVLTLHAISNIYFNYELRRSGEADAGRAYGQPQRRRAHTARRSPEGTLREATSRNEARRRPEIGRGQIKFSHADALLRRRPSGKVKNNPMQG